MTLKVCLESVFTYSFSFVVYLGYRNITFFISAVFEVSSAGAKHSLCLCVLNPQFRLIYIGPAELPLNVIFFLKFKFGDLERSRSTGEDLEIVLYGYSVYREDELR